jgi:hypothetical protein
MERRLVIASTLALAAGACADEPADTPLTRAWSDCDGGSTRHTFRADGTYALDEGPDAPGGSHRTGTFTSSAARIQTDTVDQNGVEYGESFSFLVTSDDVLVHTAGFPVGDHDGVVGSWEMRYTLTTDGDVVIDDRDLELRADGSATLQLYDYEEFTWVAYDGTFASEDDATGYMFHGAADGGELAYHFELFDDAALGSEWFCLEP